MLIDYFYLFNEKNNVSRFDSRFKSGTILKSYEDLEGLLSNVKTKKNSIML